MEWWPFSWWIKKHSEIKHDQSTKQNNIDSYHGASLFTYTVWINTCVFLHVQAYSATRYRDTTCAAMTNIRGLRLKESKATKICFCPWAKACTALWATSDFSTSWCNATSHALALALQLEQALRILSHELIIYSHTHSHRPRHLHANMKNSSFAAASRQRSLSISTSLLSEALKYTNATQPHSKYTLTLLRPLKPLQLLHWSNTHTHTHWLLTLAAGTSLYTI